MIIKHKDPLQPQIDQLNALLELKPPNAGKIEAEKRIVEAGIAGENEAAWYIDYYLRMSKGLAVIHDLRIEHRGNSAQIDHLIINRFLEFFIFESKSFKYGVEINNRGEFSRIQADGTSKSIRSPIEQNDRYVDLLRLFLRDNNIMPVRMGITLSPTLRNFVLFSPQSKILRPSNIVFNTSSVIHSDKAFKRVIKIDLAAWIALPNLVSSKTMENLARTIASHHTPKPAFDYRKKFGVAKPSDAAKLCADCEKLISDAEYRYCRQRSRLFQGKVYCRQCQNKYKRGRSTVDV